MNSTSISLWTLFLRGGWVMWPILFLSVASLAIILERLFFFSTRAKSLAQRFSIQLQSLHHSNPKPTSEQWTALAEMKMQPFVDEVETGLGLLSAIATLSPLLGLLGTVTGMVRSFMVIEHLGWKVDPSLLAGGIWEALLTTVFGLVVAIPALLTYYLFDSLAGRQIRNLRFIVTMEKQKLYPHE